MSPLIFYSVFPKCDITAFLVRVAVKLFLYVVVVNGGAGEAFVTVIDVYCIPLFLTTGVVYVGEIVAIKKRVISDIIYASRNCYADKTITISKRITVNSLQIIAFAECYIYKTITA